MKNHPSKVYVGFNSNGSVQQTRLSMQQATRDQIGDGFVGEFILNTHPVGEGELQMRDTITISWDVFEQSYIARCPELPGCISDGDSLEEALANIQDAAQCWKEARANKIPLERSAMKQALITNMDCGMSKGKENAQVSHASMIPVLNAPDNPYVRQWVSDSFTKISLKVPNEEKLREVVMKAEEVGLLAGLVFDKTLMRVTAAYVGPGPVDMVDSVTKELKLR